MQPQLKANTDTDLPLKIHFTWDVYPSFTPKPPKGDEALYISRNEESK